MTTTTPPKQMPATTPPAAATPAEPGSEPRPRRILWGIRARFLSGYVVVLAVAIGAAVVVVRQVLVAQADERISEALVQESEELRRLARGRDPRTGEPFGDEVARIFDLFLRRNVPARNETFLTFVDGRPYTRSFRAPPYRLDRDARLLARWSRIGEPDRGSVETPAGRVEYLAVPLRADDRVLGVFVAAIFRDLELRELDRAVWGAAGVGAATLLIGSLLAWRVTEGVLRRVRGVTGTARQISTGDLTRRLDVEGHDEISHLSATFNEMLDRLEEVFDTQRRFVDDAGHELRTPITIIRGHLELLEDDPVERERTLALVTDELDRMQRIVEDLLVLAKAERPDFLDLQPVHLDRLVQELHAKAEALGGRGWRLDAAPSGIVVADRHRLTQVMMELAQNAVRHTAEGAEIGIGASVADGTATLWVRDTGTGVHEGERERIFDRFARGRDRRRSQGAGLGLAIVRAIAEAHGGSVTVDSRPGEGATFIVRIPVDQPIEREDG
jgi:two-component system, OmpR family, sensor kinase